MFAPGPILAPFPAISPEKGKTMATKDEQQAAPKLAPLKRDSEGLRDALFDEMDLMRAGNTNPTRANAMAKLALGVVELVRMQLEVQRHFAKMAPGQIEKAVSVLEKPLRLGGEAQQLEAK